MHIGQICVLIGGALSFALCAFHLRFPTLFGWDTDLPKLSLANRRIIFTIHIALILLFAIFGSISLAYYKQLADPEGVAMGVLASYAGFWFWRGSWQVIYFRPPKERPAGAKFTLHYLLIVMFFCLALLYLAPLVSKIMNE
jgi:hypothetical protein